MRVAAAATAVFAHLYPLVRLQAGGMLERMHARALVVLGTAAALTFGAGLWAWKGFQKNRHEQAVLVAVGDTTERLRAALSGNPGDAYKTIDAHLRAVQRASTAPLAGAAEQYILGAREIARQRAEGARLSREAAASRAALTSHMHGGGRRSEGWFKTAVSLKRKVEQDHRNLDRSFEVLDELLRTLPESTKLLEEHVDPAALLEESVRRDARSRAQSDARRSAAELTKVRNLTP